MKKLSSTEIQLVEDNVEKFQGALEEINPKLIGLKHALLSYHMMNDTVIDDFFKELTIYAFEHRLEKNQEIRSLESAGLDIDKVVDMLSNNEDVASHLKENVVYIDYSFDLVLILVLEDLMKYYDSCMKYLAVKIPEVGSKVWFQGAVKDLLDQEPDKLMEYLAETCKFVTVDDPEVEKKEGSDIPKMIFELSKYVIYLTVSVILMSLLAEFAVINLDKYLVPLRPTFKVNLETYLTVFFVLIVQFPYVYNRTLYIWGLWNKEDKIKYKNNKNLVKLAKKKRKEDETLEKAEKG